MSKPRRRHILAPFFLVGLAAAGWCVWWFIAAGRIEQGFEAKAKALGEQGYRVAWKSNKVSGFPFRFFMEVAEPRITEPGGWGISAPKFEVETAALAPNVVVVLAPEGVVLRRPDGQVFDIKGKVLRMSVGGFRKVPPRISVEGIDLTIANGALLPTIKRFEAHIRPVAGDKAQVRIAAEEASVSPDTVLGRIAGGRSVSVRLAGEASRASSLSGTGWPGVVRNWAAGGGAFDITEGGLRAGDAMLTLKPSRITADAGGRAEGELAMTLTRAKDGMLALGAIGAIPLEAAAAASGLAGITEIGRPSIDVTLGFRDGRTHLGPLPIGPAPRLY